MVEEEINIEKTDKPRVVIIGAGFGGLTIFRNIDPNKFQTVIVDPNNFHQFRPLFYQVAMSALEPDNIVFPIRKQIGEKQNSFYVYGKAKKVDKDNNKLYTDKGWLSYDHLVIASGAIPTFFGLDDQIKENSLTMKDIRSALNIRHTMLTNLERAAIETDENEKDAYTNFVICGGGPTGVELAGSLSEFKQHIIPKDYPEYDPSIMKITLIEKSDRLLGGMSEKASRKALQYLEEMGVDVKLNESVKQYDGKTVITEQETLEARNFIWTAGVKGHHPSGLPDEVITKQDRVKVNGNLKVEGLENVYAIGDVAAMISDEYPNGHPQLAQPAIQQGEYLAKFLKGERKDVFKYKNKGVMATIGKNKAVADIGRFKFAGRLAWFLWSFVHLYQLSGFKNRFLVALNWIWSYISYEKGNRLIIRKYKRDE